MVQINFNFEFYLKNNKINIKFKLLIYFYINIK